MDRTSGASELTRRTLRSLGAWLRRNPHLDERQLLAAAGAVMRAQRSMAPLLRLANEIALASETKQPAAQLRKALRRFESVLNRASGRITSHFKAWLRKADVPEVYTYSYSSTVIRALAASRPLVHSVFCSECRPGNWGRRAAVELSRAGLKVNYATDACLLSQLHGKAIVVLGADAVLSGWVAAMAGSRALVSRATRLGCPVVFLTDTTKFWPEPHESSTRWVWTFGPSSELWRDPPPRVEVYNLYFELIPMSSRLRFLTERGWMNSRMVRAYLGALTLSTRLDRLLS